MSVTQVPFGTTKDGTPVTLLRITNSMGSYLELLDYGCTIHAIAVPDREGHLTDVALGYDTLAEYEEQDSYLGAAVGRHANRIGAGRFTLKDKLYTLACNNGENHLHGGIRGFDKYVWDYTIGADDSITFTRLSPDGEEGYPGNLTVSITYSLTRECALEIGYRAESDADTVVNLTNHNYFNLSGWGSILSHRLQLFANYFTENDSSCLPTGRIMEVADTPMDFRKEKELGADINADWEQLWAVGGYDHNYVLSDTAGLKRVGILRSPDTGIVMSVHTTMPGVQLYTANVLTPRKGKNTTRYKERSGVCLETQYFPNAMACPNFPSPVLKAGDVYDHRTIYRFSAE
ncbi:MAG: aldose epimerase family protein [Angelakisella sp.]